VDFQDGGSSRASLGPPRGMDEPLRPPVRTDSAVHVTACEDISTNRRLATSLRSGNWKQLCRVADVKPRHGHKTASHSHFLTSACCFRVWPLNRHYEQLTTPRRDCVDNIWNELSIDSRASLERYASFPPWSLRYVLSVVVMPR